jgi:hypothetical protein
MPDEPIRFDDARSTGPATCAACKRAIRDEYWSVGTVVVCPQCKAQHQQRDASHGFLTGTIVGGSMGLAGGLAGAVVWYLVARYANIQAGLVAILVGWLAGKGVASGSGHRGGRWYQILAVLITYFSIGVAQASLILSVEEAASLDHLGMLKYPAALVMGMVAPILMIKSGITGLIGLFIIFIGLAQAWRMNRRAAVPWSGPHYLTSGPASPPPPPPPTPGGTT